MRFLFENGGRMSITINKQIVNSLLKCKICYKSAPKTWTCQKVLIYWYVIML